MPVRSKSFVLCVTRIKSWTIAVAAMSASISGMGSGTCRPAAVRATDTSMGRMSPENAGMISASSQALRCCPADASRRSTCRMPRSISSKLMMLIIRSARTWPASQALNSGNVCRRASLRTFVSRRYLTGQAHAEARARVPAAAVRYRGPVPARADPQAAPFLR